MLLRSSESRVRHRQSTVSHCATHGRSTQPALSRTKRNKIGLRICPSPRPSPDRCHEPDNGRDLMQKKRLNRSCIRLLSQAVSGVARTAQAPDDLRVETSNIRIRGAIIPKRTGCRLGLTGNRTPDTATSDRYGRVARKVKVPFDSDSPTTGSAWEARSVPDPQS